jgi:type IV pilus assembly protein PilM
MPKSYLGIDLGATSIKIVEFQDENGRPRLLTYGYTEQSPIPTEKELTDDPAKAADLIKQICAKAKTTTRQAIAALPVASVFSSIISVSTVLKKDLASAVSWEAKKVIPLPLEEMILDWKSLEESPPAGSAEKEGAQKSVRVLLTAAAKNLVKKYLDVFKLSGLNLLSLETEAFALIRSLIGADKSTILIVDLGAACTNIFIVDAGIPVLNRSIDLGGAALTKALSANLGVSLAEAEQLKYDIGLAETESGSVPKLIGSSLAPLINEIKYCLNLFQSQEGGGIKKVEKIILTGGGAALPNLREYLTSGLSLRVYIGDPWARVIYPEELRPVLDEIGPKFSVSIGLAMREIG